MYGNFRPLSRICFYHSPPCNTTTQEQQRVKFNTRVERQLPWPSNIIYAFGANTKPLGAKVWGKTDNNTFQQHRAFRYLFCLSLTFWSWTSRYRSFICFPMISLHNRKCVTDRKLNSLLMRTAFCRCGPGVRLLGHTHWVVCIESNSKSPQTWKEFFFYGSGEKKNLQINNN